MYPLTKLSYTQLVVLGHLLSAASLALFLILWGSQ